MHGIWAAEGVCWNIFVSIFSLGVLSKKFDLEYLLILTDYFPDLLSIIDSDWFKFLASGGPIF